MSRLYAYAYQIVPPLQSAHHAVLRSLVQEGRAAARAGGRHWGGRVVAEEQATLILIVSDTLDRDQAINLRLEAELMRVEAAFDVTAPVAVPEQREME